MKKPPPGRLKSPLTMTSAPVRTAVSKKLFLLFLFPWCLKDLLLASLLASLANLPECFRGHAGTVFKGLLSLWGFVSVSPSSFQPPRTR